MERRTIWKFRLLPGFAARMPEGAQVLHAAGQGGDLYVWAMCDPDAPTEERRFDVYGTGHPCPTDLGRYVGTAHLDDGTLVLHVFERARRSCVTHGTVEHATLNEREPERIPACDCDQEPYQ